MKVIFQFSKPLGTQPLNEDLELESSTAAVLHRKGFGSIKSKIISIKEGPKGGLEIKTESLTKEEKSKLQLNKPLKEKLIPANSSLEQTQAISEAVEEAVNKVKEENKESIALAVKEALAEQAKVDSGE